MGHFGQSSGVRMVEETFEGQRPFYLLLAGLSRHDVQLSLMGPDIMSRVRSLVCLEVLSRSHL